MDVTLVVRVSDRRADVLHDEDGFFDAETSFPLHGRAGLRTDVFKQKVRQRRAPVLRDEAYNAGVAQTRERASFVAQQTPPFRIALILRAEAFTNQGGA